MSKKNINLTKRYSVMTSHNKKWLPKEAAINIFSFFWCISPEPSHHAWLSCYDESMQDIVSYTYRNCKMTLTRVQLSW